MKPKLIQQGAEAKIFLEENFVVKDRVVKGYRLKELDEAIRKRRTKKEERILEIQKLPQIKEPDLPLIVSLVREETLQMIIANWIGKEGVLTKSSKTMEYQPILKLWYLSINAANRMRDALGLSPQARAKLGVATVIGYDFARRMQDIEEEVTGDAK